MKTLPGTFAFVILAVIVTVTFVSCPAYRPSATYEADLEIGIDNVKYVAVNKGDLDRALKALKKDGKCLIAYLDDDEHTLTYPYPPCEDRELKTDKITGSATDKDRPLGDPNITYRVSGHSKDVKKVVKSFKE